VTRPLPRLRSLPVSASDRPRLSVVVDTEEEFDWGAPPSRSETRVTAMRHVGRAQRIFDGLGLLATYVIDYPVASQPAGFEPLRAIQADGRCSIGAHLHPWVNPPYTEELSGWNTFMMNLPADVQRDKLQRLTEQIATSFEQIPTVFKAGRYGLGAETVEILESLGYVVDASVCPRMDFSESGGPSFADFDSDPFMLTERLLELPCTVDYIGWIGHRGRRLHELASQHAFRPLRGVGVLARLGAVNRVMLSPETSSLDEMKELARSLVSRGHRILTMSFHSPSLDIGHTPYVRTQGDLEGFLGKIERFCEYFLGDLGGEPDSPLGFHKRTSLLTGQTP